MLQLKLQLASGPKALGAFQDQLGDIGCQVVNAPMAAAISLYLISPTQAMHHLAFSTSVWVLFRPLLTM